MACLLWQRVLVCFTMSVQPYTLISDYNHFLILLWIANLDKSMVTLISQYFVTICQDYQEDWGEICFFKFLKLRFWLWNFKFSGKIWKAKHWVVSKILTKAKTNVSAGSSRFPGIRKGGWAKQAKKTHAMTKMWYTIFVNIVGGTISFVWGTCLNTAW